MIMKFKSEDFPLTNCLLWKTIVAPKTHAVVEKKFYLLLYLHETEDVKRLLLKPLILALDEFDEIDDDVDSGVDGDWGLCKVPADCCWSCWIFWCFWRLSSLSVWALLSPCGFWFWLDICWQLFTADTVELILETLLFDSIPTFEVCCWIWPARQAKLATPLVILEAAWEFLLLTFACWSLALSLSVACCFAFWILLCSSLEL